jgi:hypothetical protein
MMAGFDDLEGAVEDQNEPDEDSETTSEAPEPEPETNDDQNDLKTPAFPYDDVKQSPIYPRAESWDELEDALALEITPHLHKQGVRNAEKREVHDAMVQLAVENPEQLANIVLDARTAEE